MKVRQSTQGFIVLLITVLLITTVGKANSTTEREPENTLHSIPETSKTLIEKESSLEETSINKEPINEEITTSKDLDLDQMREEATLYIEYADFLLEETRELMQSLSAELYDKDSALIWKELGKFSKSTMSALEYYRTYESPYRFSEDFSDIEIESNLLLLSKLDYFTRDLDFYLEDIPIFELALSCVEMTVHNDNIFLGGLPNNQVGVSITTSKYGMENYYKGPLQMDTFHTQYPLYPTELLMSSVGNPIDSFNYHIGWMNEYLKPELLKYDNTRSFIEDSNLYTNMALFSVEHNNSAEFLLSNNWNGRASIWLPEGLTRRDMFLFCRALGDSRVVSTLSDFIYDTKRTHLGHNDKEVLIDLLINESMKVYEGSAVGKQLLIQNRYGVKVAYPMLVLGTYEVIKYRLNGEW